MRNTGFKRLTYKEALEKRKNSSFYKKSRKPLRVVGKSTMSELKNEAQGLLREIVILRDKGCFLRAYKSKIEPRYRECGGFTKAGKLILQAEHLESRAKAISFTDERLVVCICKRHHLFYKPQFTKEYNDLAREYIGKENAKVWDYVSNYRSAFKIDLKLEILRLKQILKKLQEEKLSTEKDIF